MLQAFGDLNPKPLSAKPLNPEPVGFTVYGFRLTESSQSGVPRVTIALFARCFRA